VAQRRASKVNRCLRCKINKNLCFCDHIFNHELGQTYLSIIMHVRELTLTSNTPYFINQLLPRSSEIFIRGSINFPFNAKQVMREGEQSFYLFPDEDAIVLDDDFLKKYPGKKHLIIPDGSWSQARKFKQREPFFKPLQSVKLPDGIEGRYKLRVSPVEGGLSTFEAAAYALGILESKIIEEKMMNFFDVFVNRTLSARKMLK
jgi:DTW domain-containing protein YfiP